MKHDVIYPNLALLSPKDRKDKEKIAQVLADRARADRATTIRGTHRQKVKIAFASAALTEDMMLWGDRGQRRAAERARGLRSRGYGTVP